MSGRFDKFMIHVDIGTDEKLAGFSDSERLCHIAGVLAVAAKSPLRGCLIVGDVEASPSHIAKRSGVSARVATTTLRKLIEVGILIRDDDLGCLRVHNWERFNPAPKNDVTSAERQARYRKRKKDREESRVTSRPSHADVTRNVTPPVTPPSRPSHADEVEVEEEVEEDSPAVPTAVVARATAAVDEGRRDPLTQLAVDVVGVLQRGIDGLTTDERCTRPTVPVVLAALRECPVSEVTALEVAQSTRATCQSQDRAPNIAGLFRQNLAAASIGRVA